MTISDAKIQVALPVGAKSITKSDGTLPTIRYVPVGPNLLSNGDFETDTTGWTLQGGATFTSDAGSAKVGTKGGLITRGSNADAVLGAFIAAAPDAYYVASAWLKNGTATSILMQLAFYDAGQAFISQVPSPTITSTSYKFVQAAAAAPPNAAFVRVYFTVAGSSTQTAAVDAVVLQPGVPIAESPFTEPAAGAFAGGSVAWTPTPAAHFLGDVKVFDMGAQTSITLADSSYTRVYARRHAFAGDMLVDTGIMRIQFKANLGTFSRLAWGVLVHGSWTAAQYMYFSDASASTFDSARLVRLTRGLVVVSVIDSDGNSAQFTFRRGRPDVQVDTTRIAAPVAYQWVQFDAATRFRVYNLTTIAKDNVLSPGNVSITGSTLTEPYALALETTNPYLHLLVFAKKPSSLVAQSSQAWGWKDTGATTSAFKRTFWLAAIPWPWILNGQYFVEGEATTMSGGATSAADGAASGGNVLQLAAQNAQGIYNIVGGVDLPLGDYTLIMLATDNNHVANDLRMRARNTTDGVDNANQTKTLTGSYVYYTLDFSLTSVDQGDTIEFRALKDTATANTIKVDYFLVIPRARNSSTPAHVQFPKDVAHNALMTITQRDSIRRA